MLDRPEEYQRMRDAEDRLWWYRCLHRLVLQALEELSAPGAEADILDAGCGTGGLLSVLKSAGYQRARGFDRSPHAVQLCRERGLCVEEGAIQNLAAIAGAASLDVLIACDSLYFLSPEETSSCAAAFASVLRPNGILIVNVPALDAFRGMHDISVGIRQRFSRDIVCRMFEHPSLHIERIRFWPFLLSPLIYLARANQRRILRKHPETPIHSDVYPLPPRLNAAFEAVTRMEFRMLSHPPFGSSLFAVVRRVAKPPGLP